MSQVPMPANGRQVTVRHEMAMLSTGRCTGNDCMETHNGCWNINNIYIYMDIYMDIYIYMWIYIVYIYIYILVFKIVIHYDCKDCKTILQGIYIESIGLSTLLIRKVSVSSVLCVSLV